MTTKKTPTKKPTKKPKPKKPKVAKKGKTKPAPQKLLTYDPEMVTYDPVTLATGKTLKKQNKRKRVIPNATPITVPATEVVVIEVVRYQGDGKPQQFAVPTRLLGKAVPGLGRVVSVKML